MRQKWWHFIYQLQLLRTLFSVLKNANPSNDDQDDITLLTYATWRHKFLRGRLHISLWLALLFFLSFTLLNILRFLIKGEPLIDTELLTQIAGELSLIICLALLKTSWGNRHLHYLFLGFSWSSTILAEIPETLLQFESITVDTASIYPWIITFFTQATLMPVCWPLHLVSQVGTVGYYVVISTLLNPNPARPPVVRLLQLFWVCFICNFSVYLYERLQRAEFNTRQQLVSAYRELGTTEQKYRSIYENSVEGIYQMTLDGYYLNANPALARLYGYASPPDFINAKPNVQDLYVGSQQWDEFVTRMNEQGSVLGFESQVYCADGRIIWISDNARAVMNTQGRIIGYEGNVVEITERKQAEVEIRKSLEKEKELNQLKSRFVSMISHEFRTPLTTILASAESLERYYHKWSETKKMTYLQQIQTTVHHITTLLNDVLLIAKAEADRLPFNPAPLDLEGFCRTLVEEMQLSLSEHHQLNFIPPQGIRGIDRETVTAIMDEKLLRHIFTNLLSNAIKYSPQGGEVRFQLIYENNQAIFTIEDQGIGIPPEEEQHLFTSFYRAKNVGTLPGTGLGLAIVKRSVETHQGEITVHSQLGTGTIFTVTLPLHYQGKSDDQNSRN